MDGDDASSIPKRRQDEVGAVVDVHRAAKEVCRKGQAQPLPDDGEPTAWKRHEAKAEVVWGRSRLQQIEWLRALLGHEGSHFAPGGHYQQSVTIVLINLR